MSKQKLSSSSKVILNNKRILFCMSICQYLKSPVKLWEHIPSHKSTVWLEPLLLVIPGLIYLYTSSLYEWVIPAAWRWQITMRIRIYLFLFTVLLIQILRQTCLMSWGWSFLWRSKNLGRFTVQLLSFLINGTHSKAF